MSGRTPAAHADALVALDVEALYAEQRERILAFVRARLASGRYAEDAEDVAEEVWARIWAKRDRYRLRPDVPILAWLFTVARHVIVDHARKHGGVIVGRPERSHPMLLVALELAAEIPIEDGPERAAEAAEAAVTVARLLAGLSPLQRRVVELRYLLGLSLRETAAATGRSEQAVKKLQARGLARMATLAEVDARPREHGRWSAAEDALLVELRGALTTAQIVARVSDLGRRRTRQAVESRLVRLDRAAPRASQVGRRRAS